MNRKLCIIFFIFCIAHSAYSEYFFNDLNDSGINNSNSESEEMMVGIGRFDPPSKPRAMKQCQPGYCCPVELQCRGLFCYTQSGVKKHSVLVC